MSCMPQDEASGRVLAQRKSARPAPVRLQDVPKDIQPTVKETVGSPASVGRGRWPVSPGPTITTVTATCGVCHRVKPLAEFYLHRSSPTGHQWACKLCWPEYTREAKRAYERRHIYKRQDGRRFRIPRYDTGDLTT